MDDSWNGRNMPGSGAYVVPIDGGRGVVPLPPTNNTGTVKFDPVFLSLTNSSAVAVTLHIVVFRQGPPTSSFFTVPPLTRVSVPGSSPTAPGDLAVLIAVAGPPPPNGVLTAMVEYGTP
jgi:hypothetical protein